MLYRVVVTCKSVPDEIPKCDHRSCGTGYCAVQGGCLVNETLVSDHSD